ncbi:MAG: sulfotransferase [Bacteroidota bacterium]|nr:sulfotransferase [Bacteroidota bacterium]
MKIKDIFKLSYEDIIWSARFGLPKKKGVIYDLRQEGFKSVDRPVFFLSTGRCGTKWFARLLSCDKHLRVFHEPQPNLGAQGKPVYEIYRNNDFSNADHEDLLIKEMFLAGREQYLRYSYKTQRRFVETNNQITFFAPAIYDLLPSALFVHVYRHPGEFVRSAMRRNFYVDGNKEDLKRITPVDQSADHAKWPHFDQLQKNAWLWNETNAFIEEFKKRIPAEQILSFNFSDLSKENIIRLIHFVGAGIPESRIVKVMGKKANIQKKGTFKAYDQWNPADKQKLQMICGKLAEKYGYQL